MYGTIYEIVDRPTHKSGHTIDIVASSSKVINIVTVVVEPTVTRAFPDQHFFCKYSCNKKVVSFRNIKPIEPGKLSSDLHGM